MRNASLSPNTNHSFAYGFSQAQSNFRKINDFQSKAPIKPPLNNDISHALEHAPKRPSSRGRGGPGYSKYKNIDKNAGASRLSSSYLDVIEVKESKRKRVQSAHRLH